MEKLLDPLVKLASFGTAGVCVLAVAYIGYSIGRLSDNAPEWKARLMGRYMQMCIIIAVICAGSGIANAYFNQAKIVKAQDEAQNAKQVAETAREEKAVAINDYQQLKQVYRAENLRINEERQQLTDKINLLKSAVDTSAGGAGTVRIKPQLEALEGQVKTLRLKPLEGVTPREP